MDAYSEKWCRPIFMLPPVPRSLRQHAWYHFKMAGHGFFI
ncbi:hypothetical protein B4096_3062 [Heyndrickxia coagulans]|nr:hypothetical protein B4100_3184 [Heyndrickxia coagulans]KYC87150.1 hypothetical protein B4096_3062 [Heyndrickxia coagulans]